MLFKCKLDRVAPLIADPPPMKLHNRQNPHIQQNHRNSWTSNAIWMPSRFRISKKNLNSPFYDWKHHLQPLWRGSAVKIFAQRISDSMNEWITKVFVEQPLALPRSAKNYIMKICVKHQWALESLFPKFLTLQHDL